jgi:tetratricopeptide (TPR) repeat protein
LRAAYHWAVESDDVEAGLRLSSALFVFFWTTGYLSEGRDWLATFLERSKNDPPGPGRAWALSVAAKLAGHHGDDAASAPLAAEYLALASSLERGPGEAQVHTALGLAALRKGDLVRAREHATTALAASRASAEFSAPIYLIYLGAVAVAEGQVEEAQRHYQSALDEGRATDFMLPIGLALDGLARVARLRGDPREARAFYEEALNVLRAIGDMPPAALYMAGDGSSLPSTPRRCRDANVPVHGGAHSTPASESRDP